MSKNSLSAKIKDVYIELKDYKFLHAPFYESDFVKKRFVGRVKVKNRLKTLLTQSAGGSGTYLITGFRGMGKTSLLREAISEVNGEKDSFSDKMKYSLEIALSVVKQFLWIFLSILLFHYFYLIWEASFQWPDLEFWRNKSFSDNFYFLERSDISLLGGRNFDPREYYIYGFFPILIYLGGMALMPSWNIVAQGYSWCLIQIGNRFDWVQNLKKYKVGYDKYYHLNKVIFDTHNHFYTITSLLAFLSVCSCIFDYGCSTILVVFLTTLTAVSLVRAIIKSFSEEKEARNYKDLVRFGISILSIAITVLVALFNSLWIVVPSSFIGIWIIVFNSDGKSQLGSSFYQVLWTVTRILTTALIFVAILLSFIYSPPSYSIFGSVDIIEDLQNNKGFGKWLLVLLGVLIGYLTISLIYFIHDLLSSIATISIKKILSISKSRYEVFEINLSQENISERDVLKRINDKMLDFWIRRRLSIDSLNFDRPIYKPWQLIIKLFASGMAESPSEYQRILNRLAALQKRLGGTVSVTKDFGTNPNLSTTITGFPAELALPIGKITDNKTINYPIANAKEAEDELIDIMKDICHYRESNKSLSEFIFIIDELDKIEPQSSALIDEREYSNPAMDIANLNAPGSREYRKRQEAVAKLLANLKGFLNVAESKFFFIGGRELFDADLADIADRDSFYSSIFNDVIYVESFYKDLPEGDSTRGVTKLTETYLIKLIMSSSIHQDKDNKYSLAELVGNINQSNTKGFSIGLGRKHINQNQKYEDFEDKSTKVDLEERFKIVSLLQNFIVYLTYRSTGTPKKLNGLVEHLIVESSLKKLKNDSDALVLYCNKRGLLDRSIFLRFNYTTQYEINLTTDILRPYLITNSRFLTNLGDKLLFSTPFIFDHIIKFYPYGFSWRNLEMIPEVVLVNKEPYLRDHIKNILLYLTNYHIKQAVSGLYDYRFHSIVRKELAILSKRSDLASAAFNFTLDESLLVKRHYKKKLIELRDKHKDYTPLDGDNQFIHSLSFVQTILGDLYFYDKEYDEAILYYTESIQALRLPNGIDKRFLTRHQYLIWLRNKLKIGLTMEKVDAFDSAISLYRTLMIDSERYLHRIVNSKIDLYSETIENSKNPKEKIIETRTKLDSIGIDSRSENHRNMHLITQPFVALLAAMEKNRTDGITYANLYQNKEELCRIIDPEYNEAFLRDWKGESDIELYLLKDDYRRGWLWADYFSNVGSILFYKNCQFTRFFTPDTFDVGDLEDVRNSDIEINFSPRKFSKSEFAEDYLNNNNNGQLKSDKFDKRFYLKTDFPRLFRLLHDQYNKSQANRIGMANFFPSLTSVCYFWEALHESTKYQSSRILGSLSISDKSKYSPLVLAGMYLHPKYYDMVSARRFYYLGNIVSKIGDAILASINNTQSLKLNCLDHVENCRGTFLYPTDDPNDYIKKVDKLLITSTLFTMNKVIAIYALSSQLFKKSNQDYSYTFSLKKLLTLLKEIVNQISKDETHFDNLDEDEKIKYFAIVKDLCMDIVKSTAWYNSISNRPQIMKYRDLLDWTDKGEFNKNKILYRSSSNQSDVIEAILLTEAVRKNIFGDSGEPYFEIKATDAVRNKYNRLFELKYHIEMQFNLLPIEFRKELRKFNENLDIDNINCDKSIVLEAMFALKECIKIMQMYEPGYIIGYSFLATAHLWAGHWCRLVEKMRTRGDISNDEIKSVLGSNSMYFLEHNYQYEMAIKHYINVLQLHSEGLAYKNGLNDLYILEDDYNDSLSHFNIAFERYQVNTGVIRRRINKLRSFLKEDSGMYKYHNYAGFQ